MSKLNDSKGSNKSSKVKIEKDKNYLFLQIIEDKFQTDKNNIKTMNSHLKVLAKKIDNLSQDQRLQWSHLISRKCINLFDKGNLKDLQNSVRVLVDMCNHFLLIMKKRQNKQLLIFIMRNMEEILSHISKKQVFQHKNLMSFNIAILGILEQSILQQIYFENFPFDIEKDVDIYQRLITLQILQEFSFQSDYIQLIQISQMSAQAIKQLKIKTSMLKRLRKEYQSYEKETKGIHDKIQHMQSQLTITGKDEQTQITIRKNKQFLLESQTVLSNVKQKLLEAFQGLAQFLSQKGEQQGVAQSEQKNIAENLVLQVETFLQNLE